MSEQKIKPKSFIIKVTKIHDMSIGDIEDFFGEAVGLEIEELSNGEKEK